MIKAEWFNNRQREDEVLQPDFFKPATHFQIYSEIAKVAFPLRIEVSAFCCGAVLFRDSYIVENDNKSADYSLCVTDSGFGFTVFADTLKDNPDRIGVKISTGESVYEQSIDCEYVTISGKTTDFEGKPFPAAVVFQTHGFNKMGLGVWSGADGSYSVVVPKGEYNSIFVDDDSYGKSSLEAWGWKMILDRDETHDFKIGNGEVYSLDVWANNGGFPTLFIAFRPMVLDYVLKKETDVTKVNGRTYNMIATSPEIALDDVSVWINGSKAENISLQKIAETGVDGDIAMPLYILQIKRMVSTGKQTLILEYDFLDTTGEKAQGQGRAQFYYTNMHGTSVR
ncbi:MAG: carboxypeptidase-like regulatory domain-containing protein [Defluviitaleaceae bacterium]|nr:carboxypeptidase-like regulatory domain-containing protein [Defluviitaleaceae bacterium]